MRKIESRRRKMGVRVFISSQFVSFELARDTLIELGLNT